MEATWAETLLLIRNVTLQSPKVNIVRTVCFRMYCTIHCHIQITSFTVYLILTYHTMLMCCISSRRINYHGTQLHALIFCLCTQDPLSHVHKTRCVSDTSTMPIFFINLTLLLFLILSVSYTSHWYFAAPYTTHNLMFLTLLEFFNLSYFYTDWTVIITY